MSHMNAGMQERQREEMQERRRLAQDESESESEEEDLDDDEDSDSDSDSSDGEDPTREFVARGWPVLASRHKAAIAKVRKICRHMRKSPKQNDKLQEYVQKNPLIRKKKKLKIDVKTRWSSMVPMLKG